MNRPAHLPTLDGLRGLAILLVIAHNAEMLGAEGIHGATKAAFLVMTQGWVGVQLFFVLSGFLITGILLDSMGREGALRKFMARRALRIFPLYYGALLLIFVILPALNLQPAIYEAQAPYQGWLWAYLSNWTDPLGIGPRALGHFWSLAVEEQFYLLWPLLVFSLGSPVRVAWACLVVALASLLSRAGLLMSGYGTEVVYTWTICRIDALALGGFAAACFRIPAWSEWIRRHAWLLLGLTFGIAGAMLMWSHGLPRVSGRTMILGFSALSIFFAVTIYAAAWGDTHARPGQARWWYAWMTWPVLRNIGKYSYGMYVIHKPLHDLFSRRVVHALHVHTEGHFMVAGAHVAIVIVLSYGAAWLSYHLYEVHFLNLKRHFD